MSRNEYPILVNALWWAGGVLHGGVADCYRFSIPMGSMVFFFVVVSVADGSVVAGEVGAERESCGFESRSHLVATRRPSGVGVGRSVVEVALGSSSQVVGFCRLPRPHCFWLVCGVGGFFSAWSMDDCLVV